MDQSHSDVIPKFDDLADFSDPAQVIFLRFYVSARKLMFDYELVSGSDRHDITALELYLFHSTAWRDESTDQTDAQRTHSSWFVHNKFATKRSRIDITAGSNEIAAGLLIAAVGVEDGPARALNTILYGPSKPRDWKRPQDIVALKKTIEGREVFDLSSPLRLERRETSKPGELWIGKRKNPPRCGSDFRDAILRASVAPLSSPWKSFRDQQMRPLDSGMKPASR